MSEKIQRAGELSDIVRNGANCKNFNMSGLTWDKDLGLDDPALQEAAQRCGNCAVRGECLELGLIEGKDWWTSGVYGGVLRRPNRKPIDLLTGQEVMAKDLFANGVASLTERAALPPEAPTA